MSTVAPLCVPVDLRRPGARYFRLADAVSEEGLHFPRSLPDALDGPLAITFHLPEDPEPLHLEAIAVEEHAARDDAGPERRAVRFLMLDEVARGRIARYVALRVPVE